FCSSVHFFVSAVATPFSSPSSHRYGSEISTPWIVSFTTCSFIFSVPPPASRRVGLAPQQTKAIPTTNAAVRATIFAPQLAFAAYIGPTTPQVKSPINPNAQLTDPCDMQKFSIYAIIAIVFGVLGFSFARFCPFAAPKTAAASPQDTPPTDI